MTPEQLAQRIEASQARLDAAIEDRIEQAAEQVLRVEREIVHVVTGRLRESLTAFGPFRIGSGALEARIVPTGLPRATYADIEEQRHGYARDTVRATQGEIASMTRDIGALVAQAAEGRL